MQAGALLQGEILSNVVTNRLSQADLANNFANCGLAGPHGPAIETESTPIAIVLSQSCDLEDDFRIRPEMEERLAKYQSQPNGEQKDAARKEYSLFAAGLVNNVLLCEAYVAERVRYLLGENWKLVRQNDHLRYHFFFRSLTKRGPCRHGATTDGGRHDSLLHGTYNRAVQEAFKFLSCARTSQTTMLSRATNS